MFIVHIAVFSSDLVFYVLLFCLKFSISYCFKSHFEIIVDFVPVGSNLFIFDHVKMQVTMSPKDARKSPPCCILLTLH